MSAATWNFEIEANADLNKVLTWLDDNDNPVNLTGYSARMQIRDGDGAVVLTLSTANGRITLGGVAGTITLSVPAAVTVSMIPTASGSPHFHDLLLISGGGAVSRIVEGYVDVSEGVTDVNMRALDDQGVSFYDTLVKTP